VGAVGQQVQGAQSGQGHAVAGQQVREDSGQDPLPAPGGQGAGAVFGGGAHGVAQHGVDAGDDGGGDEAAVDLEGAQGQQDAVARLAHQGVVGGGAVGEGDGAEPARAHAGGAGAFQAVQAVGGQGAGVQQQY
jgi:hypothetical protein